MNTYIMYVGSTIYKDTHGADILYESFKNDSEACTFAAEKSLDVVMDSGAYDHFHELELEAKEEEERDLQAMTNNYEELDDFYQMIDELTLEDCKHDAFSIVYKVLVPIKEKETKKCIKVYGHDFIEILSDIGIIEEI